MKNIKFLLIVITILLTGWGIVSCTKEDQIVNITNPVDKKELPAQVNLDDATIDYVSSATGASLRDGSATPDLVLFLGSLTTDNKLVEQLSGGTVQREHKIYDKAKIAYLQLSVGLLNQVNINDVNHKHYKVAIVYKDSTVERIVAYVKSGPTNYQFIPTGESLLREGHPSKVISYTATGQTKVYYNEVRATNHVPPNGLKRWQLKMDGQPIKADYKEPTDKTTTQYQPAHSF